MFTSTPFPRGEMEAPSTATTGRFRESFSRTRQSYAYPFQQVFDETRSMLVEPEPSMFEVTLGRNRMTLPASNSDDLISALDSLHRRFNLIIRSMDNRTEIFEVINAWIEDIQMVLQCQKSNQTDISDSNFRKIQQLLQTEVETWILISKLYYERLSVDDDETASEPFNRIIRDKYCINEEPFVQAICESDPALREMTIIKHWLEFNFEKQGLPDFSEKFFIWENTWEALKRDQLLGKSTSKSMVTSIDPDAPTRQGKQLHPLDDEENNKVLRGAFYYIRTGDIDNAIAYLVGSGERVKAAGLSGYKYTCKTQEDPETGERMEAKEQANLPTTEYLPKAKRQARPRPDFDISGNTKRSLWKAVSWKVCERAAKMSKYDKALIGSVCGHREAMLGVAQSWEDRLWAFIKASIDVSIEKVLRECSVPNQRKELPESFWSQKLSISECIEKVDAFEQTETSSLIHRYFQQLQKSVMMNKLDKHADDLTPVAPQILTAFDHHLLNGQVSRFYSHLLLFMEAVDLPFSQELIDSCLEHYISVLVDVNLFTKIPFYIQKLSEEKRIPNIIHHVGANSNIGKDEIIEFLEASHQYGLDILSIAIAVVDKMRDEEDDFAVENLDWISCCSGIAENSAEVMCEFLKYTIWISRKYLTLGNISKVQKLISQLSSENIAEVAQLSEVLENTLVREFMCYKVYLEAEEALTVWMKAVGQRPTIEQFELPAAATKADRTVYEKRMKEQEVLESKWRRAVEFHLNAAIEKFTNVLTFPMGWLRLCYDPTDEDETIHVGAVRRIITKKVVNVLMRLVQDKNDNRTTRDFIYVLCDEKRNILCELSPAEIASIFKSVEQFTRQKVSNIMFLPK